MLTIILCTTVMGISTMFFLNNTINQTKEEMNTFNKTLKSSL